MLTLPAAFHDLASILEGTPDQERPIRAAWADLEGEVQGTLDGLALDDAVHWWRDALIAYRENPALADAIISGEWLG